MTTVTPDDNRAQIDTKIHEFFYIQQLIKILETINQKHRYDIGKLVCVARHVRLTTEADNDGWEYENSDHICTIRPSIRHYIDKEQLPLDVYQKYGQLQEVLTIAVSKADKTKDDHGEVTIKHGDFSCSYNTTHRIHAKPGRTKPKLA
jgi:hypothetical protein